MRRKSFLFLALLALTLNLTPIFSAAAGTVSLTSVKDTISNPAPGATSVTHTITFTTTTAISANAGNKFTVDFTGLGGSGYACANATTSVASAVCSISGSVMTETFPGAIAALTAVTFTLTTTTNPNPAGSTSYKILITTNQSGTTDLDTASAMVNIQPNLAVQLTVESDLVFTVTNTGGTNTIVYDLTPSTAPTDITKSTTLLVKTNAKNGYTVNVVANRQLTHTGYSGTTVANTIGGGTPATSTTPQTWGANDTGFGYSLNAGSTYYLFDTATARNVMTKASPSAAAGDSQVLNYKAGIDFTVPAGIYTNTITFVATPNY